MVTFSVLFESFHYREEFFSNLIHMRIIYGYIVDLHGESSPKLEIKMILIG